MIQPTKWSVPLGSGADVQELPDDDLKFASFSKIFPQITQVPLSAGGVAPRRIDFNSLFKLLADNIYFYQNGGVFEYSDTADYEKGALVRYNDNIYLCIQDNSALNVHNPEEMDYWLRVVLNNELSDYLPLAGGNVTGNLTVQNKNVVRTVNGVNADANGNTDVTRLKSINLGDFTENQEVTTLDTTEGNCILAGFGGKSHNYDLNELDWAFLQIQDERENGYQKFQLGAAGINELRYRISDTDDTSWQDWLIVSLIDEQGSNYIRYHNGIQICWGKISFTSSSNIFGNLYESNLVYQNYPKSFKEAPVVTAGSIGSYCIIDMKDGNNVQTPNFYAVRGASFTNVSFTISYIAIGRWK